MRMRREALQRSEGKMIDTMRDLSETELHQVSGAGTSANYNVIYPNGLPVGSYQSGNTLYLITAGSGAFSGGGASIHGSLLA